MEQHRQDRPKSTTIDAKGLLGETVDEFFRATTIKDVAYEIWQRMNQSKFHTDQIRRVSEGHHTYQRGQFLGLATEIYCSTVLEKLHPFAAQGIVKRNSSIEFPILPQRNKVFPGPHSSSVVIADEKDHLNHKVEFDLLACITDEDYIKTPLIGEVKQSNYVDQFRYADPKALTYLSKIFYHYPGFAVALFVPQSSYISVNLDPYINAGGAIIRYPNNLELLHEMYEDYCLSLGVNPVD